MGAVSLSTSFPNANPTSAVLSLAVAGRKGTTSMLVVVPVEREKASSISLARSNEGRSKAGRPGRLLKPGTRSRAGVVSGVRGASGSDTARAANNRWRGGCEPWPCNDCVLGDSAAREASVKVRPLISWHTDASPVVVGSGSPTLSLLGSREQERGRLGAASDSTVLTGSPRQVDLPSLPVVSSNQGILPSSAATLAPVSDPLSTVKPFSFHRHSIPAVKEP